MNWTNTLPSSTSNRDVIADLVAVAARRKLLILAVAVGTTLGAYTALSFITEQYEAEARLLVKLGRENAEVPLTVDKGGVYATGVAKEEINSNIQLLTSRGLLEATVDRIGLDRFKVTPVRPSGFIATAKFYARQSYRFVRDRWHDLLIALDLEKRVTDREAAVNLLVDHTSALRERDSNVTIVKIRLPDPALAVDAMTALLDIYRQRHIEVQRDGNLRQAFEQQATELGAELSALQQEIAQTKQEAKLSSAPEQRSQFLQRLDALRRDIDTKTSERSQLQTELRALQARLQAFPANVLSEEVVEPNPGRAAIRDRLVQMRLKRAEAVGKYAPDSQQVKSIDDDVASLEALLGGEAATERGAVTYARNPVVTQFDSEIERINVKLVGLAAAIREQQAQVASIEAELHRLDAGEDSLRLAELRRRVLEEKFLATSARTSAARISEDFDQRQLVNLAVLGAPSAPQTPVYPPKRLIMAIAIGAGLLLGLALALLLEWSSDAVRGAHDIVAINGLTFFGHFRLDSAARSR